MSLIALPIAFHDWHTTDGKLKVYYHSTKAGSFFVEFSCAQFQPELQYESTSPSREQLQQVMTLMLMLNQFIDQFQIDLIFLVNELFLLFLMHMFNYAQVEVLRPNPEGILFFLWVWPD